MAGDSHQLMDKLRKNTTILCLILTFMSPLAQTSIGLDDPVGYVPDKGLVDGILTSNSTLSSASANPDLTDTTTLTTAGLVKSKDSLTWNSPKTPVTSEPVQKEIPSQNIISSCSAFINALSDAAAEYTRCAILFARPLRFCEHCVKQYAKALHLYRTIMQGGAFDVYGELCSSLILNSDRVQIIVQTGQFIENLWDQCNCRDCYVHTKYINSSLTVHTLSNDTEEFFHLANETLECFHKYKNKTEEPIEDDPTNSTACETCLYLYKKLNDHFQHMEEKTDHAVCMDVVDLMNATRYYWSKVLECKNSPGTMWPVLILSGFFSLLPIIFYTGSRIHGARMQHKILSQRRLRDLVVQGPSVANSETNHSQAASGSNQSSPIHERQQFLEPPQS